VAPKSPGIGLLISFFLPGVGSLVNGAVGIGITILILFIVAVILDITVIGAIVGIPLGLGAWIWGMIHGYTSAQKWNRDHGIWS
jgi:TM2 domain-containing membrane protein YozV